MALHLSNENSGGVYCCLDHCRFLCPSATKESSDHHSGYCSRTFCGLFRGHAELFIFGEKNSHPPMKDLLLQSFWTQSLTLTLYLSSVRTLFTSLSTKTLLHLINSQWWTNFSQKDLVKALEENGSKVPVKESCIAMAWKDVSTGRDWGHSFLSLSVYQTHSTMCHFEENLALTTWIWTLWKWNLFSSPWYVF